MIRRLSALVMILALSVSISSPGRAESTGLDLGLLRSGMPLTELRQVSWPAGSRLLCSGDADLPTNLVSPPRNGIVPPANLARQGSGANLAAHCRREEGGISTILTDKRLEAMVREMTGEGKLSDKPKL